MNEGFIRELRVFCDVGRTGQGADEYQLQANLIEWHALGADLGQGYFFSRPVAKAEIDSLLAGEPAPETT